MTRSTFNQPKRRLWWRALGLGSIAFGLVLLAGAAVVTWQSLNAPPLYRYKLGDAVAPASASAESEQGPALRSGSVVGSATGKTLATFDVADSPAGPVLMKWDARVDAPFLHLLPEYSELSALAPVIKRHVPEKRPVLGWWDSSLQLELLSGVQAAFAQYIGEPLFVPSAWRGWNSNVESIERAFWPARANDAQVQRFRLFANALLMDEKQGMAQLRELTSGQPAVLVLHVRDVILLGQMAPDKIGVAFREFIDTGDVHGMVGGVRGWLAQHDYPAYTVMRTQGKPVRAVALTDAPSGMTLAARLLPFIGNAQHDVEGATLVYRIGGFSVYELFSSTVVAAAAEHRP